MFYLKVDVTSIMEGGDHPILCLIDGSMAGDLGLMKWRLGVSRMPASSGLGC